MAKTQPAERIIQALVDLGFPEEHRSLIKRVTINAQFAYVTFFTSPKSTETKRIRLAVVPGATL